jgi:hypothetical protein
MIVVQAERKLVKAATVGEVGSDSVDDATYCEPWATSTWRDKNLQKNKSSDVTPSRGGQYSNQTAEDEVNSDKVEASKTQNGAVSVIITSWILPPPPPSPLCIQRGP